MLRISKTRANSIKLSAYLGSATSIYPIIDLTFSAKIFLLTSVMKEFKDQLDQCLLYARAYNQREKLDGSFVLDLAKRLHFKAKQRYLEFLSINTVAQVSPLIKVWSIL